MTELDKLIREKSKFQLMLTPQEQEEYDKRTVKIQEEWKRKRYEIKYKNWIIQRGEKNHSKQLFDKLMNILDKENEVFARMNTQGTVKQFEEWKKTEKAKRLEEWKRRRAKEGKSINSDEAKRKFDELEYIREQLLEELRNVSDSKIIEDKSIDVNPSIIDEL